MSDGIHLFCPSCGGKLDKYPAISRKDNKTEICTSCGQKEAMDIFKSHVILKHAESLHEKE